MVFALYIFDTINQIHGHGIYQKTNEGDDDFIMLALIGALTIIIMLILIMTKKCRLY